MTKNLGSDYALRCTQKGRMCEGDVYFLARNNQSAARIRLIVYTHENQGAGSWEQGAGRETKPFPLKI